jgi:RNA polymerase primary sigma factor
MARRVDEATDSLQAYLRAIAKLPRLTPEAERELGRRVQESRGRRGTGAPGESEDEEALRRLVEANLRFVVSYAKRYRHFGVPFLDLIHEGNLGLIEAARRFDPARNVKFITYAVWWIRQAIVHALSDQSRAFSLPQKVAGAASRFGREVAELSAELDRAPTTREIAEDLDISEADVDALFQIGVSDVSLSERIGDADGGEGPELGDLIEQATVPPAEEELMHRTLREQIRAALGDLDEKERAVMRLRFGLDGDGEPKTLQEVGDALHLSRERIRQIESRAKEKLRRSQRATGLRSYLN